MNTMIIKRHRNALTIFLAMFGIAAMAFYTICDTSCAYLQGDIGGIDLKYIGIAYMLAIILLALIRQTALIRLFLATGLGVELYLILFQIREEVFCPFCLAFAVVVIMAFIVNHERPRVAQGGWFRWTLYGLGEIDLPILGLKKIPLSVFALAGYLFIVLTFSGSAMPVYGA